MSKTLRERDISSKTARAKLKPSGKPYWRSIDNGLHVGYRKGLRGGKWVKRQYLGNEVYAVETIGAADDHQVADGNEILTFQQAHAKARELARQFRAPKADETNLTVRSAVNVYLAGRKGRDQHLRLARNVLAAPIAERPLASLTEPTLAAWLSGLPPTLAATTKRRITTDFKAALNAAGKTHRKQLPADFLQIVAHGLAIKAPDESGERECQILPDADIRRAIDAAWKVDAADGWGGDLARIILVLAATGARFSQIIRLTVADAQANRLMVPVSAKGRGTKSTRKIAVPVGQDVIEALQAAIAGRSGSEPLLMRPEWVSSRVRTLVPGVRKPWQWSSELNESWYKIKEMAGLDKSILMYAFRHSSIVRGLRAGLPVSLVSQVHDTSVKMVERHYAAYISSALDEVVARSVIPLTSAPVAPLRVVEAG